VIDSRADALRTSRPNGWWGMAILIATEATLFATLVASFFYFRFREARWPPPGTEEPKVLVPAVLTAVLLTTSVPMLLASAAALQGRVATARIALVWALFVGSGYLAMQVYRYGVSLETLKPQESSYAATVYVLAGAHHAHVLLALLMNLFLLFRLRSGITGYRAAGVQAVALYWHFVNVLGVVVTATLLSPSV
jgi:cytochrome c oxidase subunit III